MAMMSLVPRPCRWLSALPVLPGGWPHPLVAMSAEALQARIEEARARLRTAVSTLKSVDGAVPDSASLGPAKPAAAVPPPIPPPGMLNRDSRGRPAAAELPVGSGRPEAGAALPPPFGTPEDEADADGESDDYDDDGEAEGDGEDCEAGDGEVGDGANDGGDDDGGDDGGESDSDDGDDEELGEPKADELSGVIAKEDEGATVSGGRASGLPPPRELYNFSAAVNDDPLADPPPPRMRTGYAMLHPPPILLVDEPPTPEPLVPNKKLEELVASLMAADAERLQNPLLSLNRVAYDAFDPIDMKTNLFVRDDCLNEVRCIHAHAYTCIRTHAHVCVDACVCMRTTASTRCDGCTERLLTFDPLSALHYTRPSPPRPSPPLSPL